MILRLAAALAGLLLVLAPFSAAAQATAPDSGAVVLRVAIGLLLILALIFACAWVARRFGLATRISGGANMKVVGSLALGPRDRIVMLDVGDTWLVVGINAGGMNTLHTLAAKTPMPMDEPPPDSFAHLLRRRLGISAPARSTVDSSHRNP